MGNMWEQLAKVQKAIIKLRNVSGSNDKTRILKDNIDLPLMREVLKYTYDPMLKYGLSEKTLGGASANPSLIKECSLLNCWMS